MIEIQNQNDVLRQELVFLRNESQQLYNFYEKEIEKNANLEDQIQTYQTNVDDKKKSIAAEERNQKG